MKAAFSATILFLTVAGVSWGDSNVGEEKKVTKDTFPGEKEVQWDVRVLENSPAFEVVKREVKGTSVTWVLGNKRNMGTEIVFGWQANLLDRDGVRIKTIGIEIDPFPMNMPRGERNRFILHLPQVEKWKDVRKVVITNGDYKE
jgi:hypothetical protein